MIRQEIAPEFAFTDPLQGPSGENALSNEQLALRIKGGEDHYILQLMRQNRGLFHKLAKPFVAYGRIDVDEIANLSFFAVCSAVSYWDSNMGCTFSTVLGNRFTFELLEAANRCRNAPLPRTERERLHRFYKLRREFERFGREPCDDEIMKSLKITPEQLKDLRQCVAIQDNATRLSAPIETSDGEGGELGDFIPDENIMPVDMVATDSCYQRQLQAALSEALDRLPLDQSEAIRSKFFEENGTVDRRHLHQGLAALQRQRQLAGFLNENFFSGNGLSIFQHSWTSGPERMIVQHGTKPRSRKGERQ